VKIRTLAESGTCTQAPRDAWELYPSATVCYCTENERTPSGKAKKSGLASGLDRPGIGAAGRFNERRASKFSTARG
jgi:hypothetical protein